jgi:hypothetical protein
MVPVLQVLKRNVASTVSTSTISTLQHQHRQHP